MINKVKVEQCCLCKACINACPVEAIHFTKEHKEFLYPNIDSNKCIECGLCEKVCPALNQSESFIDSNEILTCAVKNKNLEDRIMSSSGGMFIALAQLFLSKNGYVCGAVFDEEFQVKHVLTNDLNLVKQMQGSKYVQSDIGYVYREIKELVKRHVPVLFCGCPCQVSGLKRYLSNINVMDSLFTVDFICHGIPSQKMFSAYKQYMERKYKSAFKKFEFRNKNNGWHHSNVSIVFESGKKYYNPIIIDVYMKAFLSGVTMKESCYECKYKNLKSGSDITIGDFWGAEAEFPNWDDNKGISAVLVNTEKGKRIFEQLPVEKKDAKIDTIIKYNRNLIESTARSGKRDEFFELAEQKDFCYALCEMFEETKSEYIIRKSKFALRCILNILRGKGKPLY